jgi:hypothetical protein
LTFLAIPRHRVPHSSRSDEWEARTSAMTSRASDFLAVPRTGSIDLSRALKSPLRARHFLTTPLLLSKIVPFCHFDTPSLSGVHYCSSVRVRTVR